MSLKFLLESLKVSGKQNKKMTFFFNFLGSSVGKKASQLVTHFSYICQQAEGSACSVVKDASTVTTTNSLIRVPTLSSTGNMSPQISESDKTRLEIQDCL
jgi:hypothetical protein